MSAPDPATGIAELVDLLNLHLAGWRDFGYQDPPSPESKTVPPLGERSARAIKSGHEAVDAIDALTRQLYLLREQLVDELRENDDINAVRVDALLARRRQERM